MAPFLDLIFFDFTSQKKGIWQDGGAEAAYISETQNSF